MKHCTEEDLILHYYGERDRWRIGTGVGGSRVDRHLDRCADCAAQYRSLAGTLKKLDWPATPERGEQYGLEVWQRIRHRLPEQDAPRWTTWTTWTRWARWPRGARGNRPALAAAMAVLAMAAFLAGRLWPNAGSAPPATLTIFSPKTAGTGAKEKEKDGRQRILLTSVADHLDRSERILTEIMNAPDGGDISAEQRWADDLIATSRLYRHDAVDAGEQSVAGVLDEIERNLLEVVHSPSHVTAANLEEIRRRIDAAALLFKVRVLGDELRQRELTAPPAPPHVRAATSTIS